MGNLPFDVFAVIDELRKGLQMSRDGFRAPTVTAPRLAHSLSQWLDMYKVTFHRDWRFAKDPGERDYETGNPLDLFVELRYSKIRDQYYLAEFRFRLSDSDCQIDSCSLLRFSLSDSFTDTSF
jgi:hypothetical protein